MNNTAKSITEVTKNDPCLHCGKPDWCYRLGELTICKRGAEPALGWIKTSKADAEGGYYYAPIQVKATRPKSKKEYFYSDRNGRKLVKVTRTDDGAGNKKFYQSRWENNGWVNGLTDGIKPRIPIYRYAEVRQAIANGELIFFVEGEGVADQLWNLGLAATTTIGGSGKYRSYGSYKADLEGADLVLCPDRDEVGLKYMDDVATDFPDVKWLFAPPSEFFWQHLPKSGGADVGDWIAEGATVADIISAIDTSTNNNIRTKNLVSPDNSSIVTDSSDNNICSKPTIDAIVTTVTTILGLSVSEREKSNKLDQLYLDFEKIDRRVFDRIVATERLRLEELSQECKERLQELVNCGNAAIDWEMVLPAPLARDLVRDAAVRNIDPVVIWQPLLSAIASLAGIRINLDVESHIIPAICWTATVLESGGGKTRGDSLVLNPLRKMQGKAVERYKDAEREYKRSLKEWDKNPEGEEPEPPILRKYLFDIATIQSVIKRSADNKDKGVLWARDELEGLFNSLGQFSGKADEALQILLMLWNGGSISVDRTSLGDSFYAEDTALSLTGGIQPGVFRNIFQDAQDSNGLQARILFAVPQRMPQRRIKDYCRLSEHLPLLYEWVDKLPPTMLKLSPDADLFYTELVELQESEILKTSTPAVRAWLAKWSTQIMRLAIILHLIECFYGQRAVDTALQKETLERAAVIGQYYRNAFQFLQEKVSDTDDIPTILLQIQDRAQQSPTGITIRDIYRQVKKLSGLAKEAGVSVAAYTEQMCEQLVDMGYGELARKGRSNVYTAKQKKDNITLGCGDSGDNSSNAVVETVLVSPDPVTVCDSGDNSSNAVVERVLVSSEPAKMNVSPGDTKILYGYKKFAELDKAQKRPALNSGARVTIHCPGSKRDGKTGKIDRITKKDGVIMATVLIDGETGKHRRFECPVPGDENMHLRSIAQEEQQ